ncbi:MAG: thioredoxin [Culicoidibacterales bacterium]
MAVTVTTVEEFQAKVASGKYLVDFYATWCGPCQMLLPVLEEVTPTLAESDVEILKVNVDELPQLAQQYGVMSVPSLFVIADGKIKNSDAGFKPADALVDWVTSNLA